MIKFKKKPLLIKKQVFFDRRGFFQELYLKKNYKFNSKFTAYSYSKKNVIRGLHYQVIKPQEKILSVLQGEAVDICVNINKKSKDYGKVYKFILKPGYILFVPKNFAHGIGFLAKKNILLYHFSEYRFANHERGINPLDKKLKINWKIKNPILSKRDKLHPNFDEIK
tara:strand:+ start:3784 stop:4284 length:501 start_codon:yes stop_codon:yes gene_type:complete